MNSYPSVLNEAIGLPDATWLSPLEADEYAEYRDDDALGLLGIQPTKRSLSAFWPRRGPQWDALGRTADATTILVEAKAHIPELLSPPTQAAESSRRLLRASLGEAATALRARPGMDWSLRFYQYANRVAHAYFLHDLNDVRVVLAFVHFVGDQDMHGPASRAEWEAALMVLEEALGLRGRLPSYVRHAFIDVRGPSPVAI